ncbi:hypothetical protein EJ02DRAFT_346160 [Clathrospora elynae]|uniref:F-box domain-containing protein n=1 Tax=Clathrospora elynae TaxID=706981 RepID=A0A6A5SR18_9PLEO|nr:hypothetical protein EJ02DRAFT_346160 [Clathrospora elynae]
MSSNLLSLPSELLSQILARLPMRSLLKFAETSRRAHFLANANLHTLSLGIHTLSGSSEVSKHPYDVWLRIPDAHTYDYMTLLSFQSALLRSILLRHDSVLQTVTLSIWTLTTKTAEAIARLIALRSLSIRIEGGAYGLNVPRSHMAIERVEQRKAWSLLSSKAVWRSRLYTLRLENADLNTEQLVDMLRETRCCAELWLSWCRFVGKELWKFLGEWRGNRALRVLGLAECGGVLSEATLGVIGGLGGLQSLNLYDCKGLDSSLFEACNRDIWHIVELISPKMIGDGKDMIIEVDPEYEQEM